jgi:pilus assembly protein TadC
VDAVALAWPIVIALAALLAAAAVCVWSGPRARARDRLGGRTRSGSRVGRYVRERRARAVPGEAESTALAVDLIAACLEAGVALPAALAAGSAAAGGSTGNALGRAAAALRRGGDAAAWAGCATDPRLAGVVRICRRVGTTGAAAADELRRLAAEQRRAHQANRRRRAHRAAVWVVLPLGLCFLPAFLLLSVVPVVAALLPAVR